MPAGASPPRRHRRAALGFAALLLAGCGESAQPPAPGDGTPSPEFPEAHRPIAPIISSRWSSEEARDRRNEADDVMAMAGIAPGMTVADIGAGEGYYTVRLAKRVGAEGRVLAQDIVPAVRDALAERVVRETLENVSVRLGLPDDPRLPANSFDRVLMVHMYHEIAAPYAFLWRLRPALRPDGRVIVVDADRPTQRHGTPPALLQCEFEAVGYRLLSFEPLPQAGGYLAMFGAAPGARPRPDAIRPCAYDPSPPDTAGDAGGS